MKKNFFISGSMAYEKGSAVIFEWFETEVELKAFIKTNKNNLTVFETIEILDSRDIDISDCFK